MRVCPSFLAGRWNVCSADLRCQQFACQHYCKRKCEDECISGHVAESVTTARNLIEEGFWRLPATLKAPHTSLGDGRAYLR